MNKIIRKYNSSVSEITKNITLLLFLTFASRLLGIVREAIIARSFGAGNATDTLFAAFRIPDFLFNNLLTFLIASPFIPIFQEYLVQNKIREKWVFLSNTINITIFALIVITIIVEILTKDIINIIVPGFSLENKIATAKMLRIMMPIIIFAGLSGFFKSILNTLGHFIVPAFIPIVFNLVLIGSTLLGKKEGIYAIAIGILIASIIQALIHIPILIKKNIKIYWFLIDVNNDGFKKVLLLIMPIIAAISLDQLVSISETVLCSKLQQGALSYINYANKIYIIPEQLIIMSITTVLFPAFAACAAKNDYEGMKQNIEKGIIIVFRIILPASIFFIIYSQEIVYVILGGGKFSNNDIKAAGLLVMCYSAGLIFICMRHLMNRVLISLKKAMILLKITVFMVPLNIILNIVFVKNISFLGIALGFIITALIQNIIMNINIKSIIGPIITKQLVNDILKISIISTVTFIIIYFIKKVTQSIPLRNDYLGMIFYLSGCSILSVLFIILGEKMMKNMNIKIL